MPNKNAKPKIDLRLKGEVKLIKREKIKPPDDGIHRAGKEGFIKGVHSVMFDDILVPKGSVGFYYPLEEQWGVKVYIGGFPDKPWCSKLSIVETAFKRMFRLSLARLAPSPGHVIGVQVEWKYKNKTFKKKTFGLTSYRCQYPTKAWENYAKGLPYDFTCLDPVEHPDHSTEGYRKFCKQLYSFCKSNKWKLSCYDYRKDKGPKIGDAVYDMKSKQWLLVDVD